MALVKCSITKQATFQGQTEKFSNVYTFVVPSLAEPAMQTLLNNIMEVERPIFAPEVRFVQGYAFTDKTINTAWTRNLMHGDRTWSVQGTSSGAGNFYGECAFLVKWPLPRKVTDFGSVSRKRQLLKYLHTFTSMGESSMVVAGMTQITTTSRTLLTTYATNLAAIPDADLCSQDGSLPSGPPVVHNYIEHRQFPRGRKES